VILFANVMTRRPVQCDTVC